MWNEKLGFDLHGAIEKDRAITEVRLHIRMDTCMHTRMHTCTPARSIHICELW